MKLCLAPQCEGQGELVSSYDAEDADDNAARTTNAPTETGSTPYQIPKGLPCSREKQDSPCVSRRNISSVDAECAKPFPTTSSYRIR